MAGIIQTNASRTVTVTSHGLSYQLVDLPIPVTADGVAADNNLNRHGAIAHIVDSNTLQFFFTPMEWVVPGVLTAFAAQGAVVGSKLYVQSGGGLGVAEIDVQKAGLYSDAIYEITGTDTVKYLGVHNGLQATVGLPLVAEDGDVQFLFRQEAGVGGWYIFDGENQNWQQTSTSDLALAPLMVQLPDYVQRILHDTAPTVAGVLADESTKGTARDPQPGRAYLFDGVNDFIDVGSRVTPGGPIATLTASAWFKTNDADAGLVGEFSTVSNQRSWLVYLSAGKLHVLLNGDGSSAGNYVEEGRSVADGVWHHVAFSYTGSGLTVYLDGTVESMSVISGSVPASLHDTVATTTLGGYSEGTLGLLDGQLFDVRVYNNALTVDEIEHIRTFGKSGTDPTTTNLVGHWKCDDTSATTAYDSSGNGNHGTKTNITPATFHYEGNDVPYSWQNQVGFSENENYVKQSHSLTTSPWVLSGVTAVESGDFWQITRTTVGPGAAVQSNITSDLDDYVISLTLRAGSSSRISIGLYAAGWNCVDYEIVSGSGSVSGVGSLATISGLDSSDTVLKLQYKPQNAPTVLYLYPDTSIGSGVVGSTNLVKDIQIYKGTLATPQPGIVETGADQVIGLQPRNEANTANDVLGNPLQYSGKSPLPGKLVQSHCGTFDGANDYVNLGVGTIGGVIDGSAQVTVSAWVLTETGSALTPYDNRVLQIIINGSGSSAVLMNVETPQTAKHVLRLGGRSQAADSFQNIDSTKTLTLGKWHHLVGIYDFANGQLSVAVDGELESPVGVTFGASALTLGTPSSSDVLSGTATGTSFDGSIADVRVYNDALTADEIKHIYTGGRFGTDPTTANLVSHWPLAEGAGTVAYDRVGNNHGTITNATQAALWGTTQDDYHANLANGFSFYEHATADPIYVPYGADGNPLVITPPTGYALSYHSPAGAWHNGAESKIDFTGGIPSPESVDFETAWAAGDDRTNPRYVAECIVVPNVWRDFRAYETTLTTDQNTTVLSQLNC